MKKNIIIFLVMLAAAASMTKFVSALQDGPYIVSNNTHYVNPDAQDSGDGGDPSIGEGMCRNATYPQSRYEAKEGRHIVTLRFNMISYISDIRLEVQTQKGDGKAYAPVVYTASGYNEEENTGDFTFEVQSADMLIKPTFFVGPMGRDVTFFVFLDMTTAIEDDGSFAAFNDLDGEEEGQIPDTSASSSPADVSSGDKSTEWSQDSAEAAGEFQETKAPEEKDRNPAPADDRQAVNTSAPQNKDRDAFPEETKTPDSGDADMDGPEPREKEDGEKEDRSETAKMEGSGQEGEEILPEDESDGGGINFAVAGLILIGIAAAGYLIYKRTGK